jgi:RNA polymerase sigma-70 factor (ECF subfamily)
MTALPLQDIGRWLRLAFADAETAPLPPRLQALLDRLCDTGHPEADFKAALTAVIPQLRRYGRSLSGSADLADDLVQETMLRAWTARHRFVAGSSMRAWTHVILRNVYFSIVRRRRFVGEWDALASELLLAVAPTQDSHVALGDLQRALMQLPAEQREALVLIGVSGLSCEEVAEIGQCAVGTVKSRVARARAALHLLLEDGQLAVSRAAMPASTLQVLDQIMLQAQTLAAPRRLPGLSRAS